MGGCHPAVGLSSCAASGSEILFYHYHGFRCLRSYTTWLLVRRPAITGLLNLVRYAHSITSNCPINYNLSGCNIYKL